MKKELIFLVSILLFQYGGGVEIRTPAGPYDPLSVFKTDPFSRLGTPPNALVVHRRLERRTWRL